MKLIDCHIHSTCSEDGLDPMPDMARASHFAGVGFVCFTEHVDLDRYETGIPDPDCFSHRRDTHAAYRKTLETAPGDLKVRLGVELGEGNHDPVRAQAIAASEEFDFVLGSLHNVLGTMDFYGLSYESEAFCKKMFDRYVAELLDLARLDFYDSMAHIGYPVRYSRKAGLKDTAIDMHSYGDELTEILKTLIQTGKGLELNTVGYRDEYIGGPIPSADVLRRYRELGGELITIGSDAHSVSQAGSGLKLGLQLLQRLGFSYVTVFEGRKPQFVQL